MENLFHIHGSNDGICSSGAIIDQLHSLSWLDVLWEPRRHPTEVHPSPQLHGGKGNTGPLLDSYHHHPLMVLHYDKPLEVSRLLFVEKSHQLLLQR